MYICCVHLFRVRWNIKMYDNRPLFGLELIALEMFVEQNSKNNPSRERLRGIDTLEIFRFITHRIAIQDLLIGPQNHFDVARWPSWSSSISQSLMVFAKIRHSRYDDGLRLNPRINAIQRSRAIWSRRSRDETINRRIDPTDQQTERSRGLIMRISINRIINEYSRRDLFYTITCKINILYLEYLQYLQYL